MPPMVRKFSSLAHGLSPSTRPGFIRADEIEKLFAALKLLHITPSGSENGAESKPLVRPVHMAMRGPTKTELATIKLFPKGMSMYFFLVVQFLRNQDHPFQPRALLQPLSSAPLSEESGGEICPTTTPSLSITPLATPILFANVKKKRKARMNKHKRKKRRRALRYKAPSNK